MNVLFIGTGSGKTSLKRFHSSLLISINDFSLLVDAGDSVSRALLSSGVSFDAINGVVITHLHPDHFSGFASLIVQMKMSSRTETLTVYIHHTLVNTLKDFLSSSYVFLERMGFPVIIKGFDFEFEMRVTEDLTFRARGNTHLEKYKRNAPALSLVSSSLLFTSGDKKVFYSGDLGSIDDLYLFKDYSIDLYITEATHVDIENILEMMKLLNPGEVILTHIADEDVQEIHRKINESGQANIKLAEDGMNFSVRRYIR